MAPVDGTVQQLAIHAVGGVVTLAQPLMENKDIGFVKVDQSVVVKVETFPFTRSAPYQAP